MGTLMIVVEQKFANNVSQLFIRGKNKVVEAFSSKSLYKGFDITVLFRAKWPCPFCLASGSIQNTRKAAFE